MELEAREADEVEERPASDQKEHQSSEEIKMRKKELSNLVNESNEENGLYEMGVIERPSMNLSHPDSLGDSREISTR